MTVAPLPKDDLRAVLMQERRNLVPESVRTRSAAVTARLRTLPEFERAACIGAYLAILNEVDLSELIRDLCGESRTVCVPRMLEHGALEFGAFEEACLIAGPRGVTQPDETAVHVPLEKIDLLIVPGVGFDERGYRIGMGAAYYDRTLADAARRPLTVGVGYDFQLVDEIPHDPWDVPLDIIVTETKTVRCGLR